MKMLAVKLVAVLMMLASVPAFALAETRENANNATMEEMQVRDYFRVRGKSYINHRVYLYEGNAEIGISGDGDTNLDLYFYDDSNRLIARSEGYGDDEYMSLNIYRSGYFYVQVVNRGKVYNDYLLAVE